jgi:hypothetical protein
MADVLPSEFAMQVFNVDETEYDRVVHSVSLNAATT